ncbi:MAG: UPF0149 family protein [Formivibrio sp.]|nr:UPF0149 family protein [Formivibrio sp.]
MSKAQANEPMTEAQLDELAQLLDSDLTPEDCMDLSMLQGYLTAVLVGPEVADPEQWLVSIWGEGADAVHFSAKAEAARLVELVVMLYNDIDQQLQSAPDEFEPILYLDEESELQIARPWCMGFMYGAALNEAQWQPLLDDEEYGSALLPIVMCADEEGRAEMEASGENPNQFEDEVADELPEIVGVLHGYWSQMRTENQKPARPKGRRR